MEFVRLGRTGLKVSRLSLGCMTYGDPKWHPWVLDAKASWPFIRGAWEAGINFFDTADMYSRGASEEILGASWRELAPRDRLVIATKVYNAMSDDPNDRGLSRKHIMASIDASLRRLRTDHVDLYQIHRFDPETPLEETLEALDAVVRAGKARYLGASSMFAWQFMKALGLQAQHGWHRFVAMQNHYNLLYREEEREMMALCRSEGIGVIPWSPLARGYLAGRKANATARSDSDASARTMYDGAAHNTAIIEAVARIAAARGTSPAAVALAWLLAKPAIAAPIVGISKPGHLEQALAALALKLTGEEIAALEAPYRPRAIAGHS